MKSLPFYSHLIFLYFIQCACICAYASACSLSLNFCCCFFSSLFVRILFECFPIVAGKTTTPISKHDFSPNAISSSHVEKWKKQQQQQGKNGSRETEKKLCIENNEEKPSFDMNIVHDVSLLFTLLAICAKFMYLDKNWRCTLLLWFPIFMTGTRTLILSHITIHRANAISKSHCAGVRIQPRPFPFWFRCVSVCVCMCINWYHTLKHQYQQQQANPCKTVHNFLINVQCNRGKFTCFSIISIYMYVCMNGMKWNEKGSPCLCLDYVCFHSWQLPNISNMCNCSAHTHTHIHSHKYTPFSKNWRYCIFETHRIKRII